MIAVNNDYRPETTKEKMAHTERPQPLLQPRHKFEVGVAIGSGKRHEVLFLFGEFT